MSQVIQRAKMQDLNFRHFGVFMGILLGMQVAFPISAEAAKPAQSNTVELKLESNTLDRNETVFLANQTQEDDVASILDATQESVSIVPEVQTESVEASSPVNSSGVLANQSDSAPSPKVD